MYRARQCCITLCRNTQLICYLQWILQYLFIALFDYTRLMFSEISKLSPRMGKYLHVCFNVSRNQISAPRVTLSCVSIGINSTPSYGLKGDIQTCHSDKWHLLWDFATGALLSKLNMHVIFGNDLL